MNGTFVDFGEGERPFVEGDVLVVFVICDDDAVGVVRFHRPGMVSWTLDRR